MGMGIDIWWIFQQAMFDEQRAPAKMWGIQLDKVPTKQPDANHSTGVYGDVANYNGEKQWKPTIGISVDKTNRTCNTMNPNISWKMHWQLAMQKKALRSLPKTVFWYEMVVS